MNIALRRRLTSLSKIGLGSFHELANMPISLIEAICQDAEDP